jgi:hypothetical protein
VAIRVPKAVLQKENGLPRRFAPRNDGGGGRLFRAVEKCPSCVEIHKKFIGFLQLNYAK